MRARGPKTRLGVAIAAAMLVAVFTGTADAAVTLQALRGGALVKTGTTYGFFASKDPYTARPMASTTKVMTMHLALDAVKAGKLAFTTVFTISTRAAQQTCNCFGGSQEVLQGGDTMTLDDALYGVALSNNDVTAAVAELVANAVKHSVKETGKTDTAKSDSLTAEFVQMMNDHVTGMNLGSTAYKNPQGWDNPGDGNYDDAKGNHYTSVSDLTILWEHARSNSSFLTYMGFRNHTISYHDASANADKTLPVSKSYGYYPNVRGDKNGITPDCIFCVVSQARRLGVDMYAAVLQAPSFNASFSDIAELFRYGYDSLFKPVRSNDSGSQAGAIVDQSMDCMGQQAVTFSHGGNAAAKLIVWSVKLGTTSGVQRLGSATQSLSGVPTDVDVTNQGDVPASSGTRRVVVTAARTSDNVTKITTWELSGSPTTPTKLGSLDIPSTNTIKLLRISPTVVALAYRNGATFKAALKTFKIGTNGLLTAVSSLATSSTVENERPGLASVDFTSPNTELLSYWRKGGGSDGLALTFKVDRSAGTATAQKSFIRTNMGSSRLSAATTGALLTIFGDIGRFMTSYPSYNGQTVIDFYNVFSDGSLSLNGTATDQAQPSVTIAGISSNASNAVFSLTRDGSGLTPGVWEWNNAGNAPTQFYKLSEKKNAGGAATKVDLCRITPSAQIGDYISSMRDGGGNLKLIGWRVMHL